MAEINRRADYAAHSLVAPWLSERSALFSLCLRWTRGDVAEAEDLLSDACLRILEGGEHCLAEVASPIAFWATVINNLGRDRSRRTRRWNFDARGSDASVLGALPADTTSAEQQVLLNECLTAASDRLMRLSEKQRNAVLLRGGGLGYSEIAETLRTSSANARKLVETARKVLNAPQSRWAVSRREGAMPRLAQRRSYLVES